jgi:hypothetical protein
MGTNRQKISRAPTQISIAGIGGGADRWRAASRRSPPALTSPRPPCGGRLRSWTCRAW